jgi:hypothetical protein
VVDTIDSCNSTEDEVEYGNEVNVPVFRELGLIGLMGVEGDMTVQELTLADVHMDGNGRKLNTYQYYTGTCTNCPGSLAYCRKYPKSKYCGRRERNLKAGLESVQPKLALAGQKWCMQLTPEAPLRNSCCENFKIQNIDVEFS